MFRNFNPVSILSNWLDSNHGESDEKSINEDLEWDGSGATGVPFVSAGVRSQTDLPHDQSLSFHTAQQTLSSSQTFVTSVDRFPSSYDEQHQANNEKQTSSRKKELSTDQSTSGSESRGKGDGIMMNKPRAKSSILPDAPPPKRMKSEADAMRDGGEHLSQVPASDKQRVVVPTPSSISRISTGAIRQDSISTSTNNDFEEPIAMPPASRPTTPILKRASDR